MGSVKKIITPALLQRLSALKPDQVIFGTPDHPRRLKATYEIPEYATGFVLQDNHAKMCYCRQGTCVLVLNGNSFMMKTGDLAFISRNTEYYVSYLGKKKAYSLLWFVTHGWGNASLHHSVYNQHGVFRVMDQQQIKVPMTVYRDLDQAIVQGRTGTYPWVKIQQHITALFAVLGGQKLLLWGDLRSSWQQRILDEVALYVKAHCRDQLTLPQVARQFSFSPAYLDVLFKRTQGQGVIHFLNGIRLREAANRLQQSALNININQIATACGFNDIYYFRRVFKKYYGLTPTEYRQNFC